MADTRIFKLTEIAKSGDQATKTVFYTSDSTSGSVWVVKPGQMVVPHTHPTGDDFWYCVKGQGLFYLQVDQEVAVTQGDMIISSKGQCHGLKNTGKDDFIFVFIVGPLPVGYEKLTNS